MNGFEQTFVNLLPIDATTDFEERMVTNGTVRGSGGAQTCLLIRFEKTFDELMRFGTHIARQGELRSDASVFQRSFAVVRQKLRMEIQLFTGEHLQEHDTQSPEIHRITVAFLQGS